MTKFIMSCLAMSVFLMNSAFAQNLGVLSDEQKPQKLVSASEFANFLNSPHEAQETTVNSNQEHGLRSDLWGWGWGGYWPYYYYPYYAYSRYYPYYWWLNEQGSQVPSHVPVDRAHINANHATANASPDGGALDMSRTPVVCFASDSSGTWFAQADIASNVLGSQEAANAECLATGASCTQNLGCAIAHQ